MIVVLRKRTEEAMTPYKEWWRQHLCIGVRTVRLPFTTLPDARQFYVAVVGTFVHVVLRHFMTISSVMTMSGCVV